MNRIIGWLILGAAVLVGGCALLTPDVPQPAPAPMPAPAPEPAPKPCPPNKPCPRVQSAGLADPIGAQICGAKVAGPTLDGTELAVDLPGNLHRKNTSSKGLGLCVFTSLHHAAEWQDVDSVKEMPKWMIGKGIAGGGYPGKVAQLIPRLAQERGLPTPEFIQAEHYDYEVLKAVCASGRMACVTYSKSPTGRYGGSRIAHMVNVVHADDKWVVVLDNNYPGEAAYEWMSPAEAKAAGVLEWLVVFTSAPPPPPPHNGGPAPPRPTPTPTPTVSEQVKTCPCSAECSCGCNAGRPCRCAGPDPALNGVVAGKIGDKPTYRHGEYVVTRDDALSAIEGSIPQDRQKPRVTFIGSKEERSIVDAHWRSSASVGQVKDAFVYRSYDAGHWHVARYGFAPGLTVTDSSGKELAYAKSYPGEQGMAETLRRLRPDYVPGGGSLVSGRSKVPVVPLAALAVAGGAAYVLSRRKKVPQ